MPSLRFASLAILLFVASPLCRAATTYYLDSSVGSSGSGTSGSPFKDITNVPGLGSDDVLNISCGATGQTRTYNVPSSPGYWNAGTGTSGHPFIIQVWQDSTHGEGVANFVPASDQLFSGPTFFTFSGKYAAGTVPTKMHFVLTSWTGNQVFSNCNHMHMEYVDGSAGVDSMGDLSLQIGLEINNVSMKMMNLAGDHMAQLSFAGSTYSDNKIHHSTFLIPRNGPAFGADCFSFAQTGIEIYNCTIQGYNAAYTGGQHQDGIQAGGGSFYSIHDCKFIDIANSAVYLESVQGPYQNIRLYNNQAIIQDSALNTGSPSGFICGINAGYVGSSPCHQLNIIFSNNMIIDYNWGNGTAGIAISNDFGVSADFVGCYLVNTISVNGTTAPGITGNTTSTVSNNLFLTASQAGTGGSKAFTTYTTYSPSNVYTVNSTSSPQYHAGVNMQGVFTFTDYTGAAWNNPPSEGPYEFGSASAPVRLSSTVNAAGSQVTLLLDQSCTTGVGGNGGYSISASGGACSLTYLSGSGSSSYVYTTGRTINTGETIADTYVQPTAGIASTTSGIDLASFSSQSVTNNSTQGTGAGGSRMSGKVSLSGKVTIK